MLFDGIFLQRPELAGLWDLTVWVDAPFELTVERAACRDARDGSDIEVIEQCRPSEQADIFIDNTDLEHPTIKFIHRN